MTICLDISDLIEFYRTNSHVTGIQRVVENIVTSAEIKAKKDLVLLCRLRDSAEFFMVFKDQLALLKDEEERDHVLHDLRLEVLVREFNIDGIIRSLSKKYTRKRFSDIYKAAIYLLRQKLNLNKLKARHNLLSSSIHKFSTDDRIVVMGAFWLFPDYVSVLQKIHVKYKTHICSIIYDLIPISHPHLCDEGTVSSFRSMIDSVLKISSSYITISKYVSHTIEKHIKELGLDKRPIFILPLGSDIYDKKKLIPKRVGEILSAHQLKQDSFILSVGTLEPRKNYSLLIDAWKILYDKIGHDLPILVICGRPGWKIKHLMNKLVALDNLNGKIQLIHGVEDEEIAALYTGAKLTICASLMEGWGLPVAESLSYGKITLSSNAGALPEAGRELADYFDPLKPDHIVELVLGYMKSKKKIAVKEKNIRNNYKKTATTWQGTTENFLNFLYRQNPKEL